MKLKPINIKKVVTALAMTRNEEIDCGNCYDQLDRYVEMLQDGDDPSQLMPLVKQHLEICKCCQEETEALLEVLESMDGS